MANFTLSSNSPLGQQLECVSCKGTFTIDANRTARVDLRNKRRQSQPDRYPVPQSHRQDNVHLYPITAPPPSPSGNSRHPSTDRNQLPQSATHCPRCGADNRNWLQIRCQGQTNSALNQVQHWWQNFALASVGLLVTVMLTLLAFWRHFTLTQTGRSLILLLAILLAGFVPAIFMIRQWSRLRDYKNFRQIMPARSILERSSPSLLTALYSAAFFLFLIPFLFYVLIPWSANIASSLTSSATPPAQPSASSTAVIDWAFLQTWLKYVGASAFIATIFAMLAVNGYVSRVNSSLPQPIFFNVANMTRVAIKEAKRVLEIQTEMDHIQWMSVKRNGRGGIDLVGVYRDVPDLDERGSPRNNTVRAQTFTISTDRWARVETAQVKDTRVPATTVPRLTR